MRQIPANAFRAFCISAIIAFTFVLVPANPVGNRDWQPQKTWVFVVGILRWENQDMFNSFPQTNRRDAQLVEFFRQQGVPPEQLVFLKDAQATSRRVTGSFRKFLSQSSPGDLLFFYYTGHGYKSDDARRTFFATYDAGEDVEGWAVDSIVSDIEKYFKGSRALLTADTCYSGSLAAQTQSPGRRVSYASLTSSSASQESTENWTFTEMLLAGFRGNSYADINGDGEVTLSELAEDIKEDMAFAEGQRSTFATTGSFPAEMLVAPATSKIDPLISKRIEVHSEGDWYKARVIDARGSRYRVHYYGFEDSDDEWVSTRQMRSLKTKEDSRASRRDDWVATEKVRELKVADYHVGSRVEVNWQGKWYPARVLRIERGAHLIHYIGYDDRWDEWVSADRIRRLPDWN